MEHRAPRRDARLQGQGRIRWGRLSLCDTGKLVKSYWVGLGLILRLSQRKLFVHAGLVWSRLKCSSVGWKL